MSQAGEERRRGGRRRILKTGEGEGEERGGERGEERGEWNSNGGGVKMGKVGRKGKG